MTSGTTLSIDEIRDNNARIVLAWHLAKQSVQSKDQELSALKTKATKAAAKLAQLLGEMEPDWPEIAEYYDAIEHGRMQKLASELNAARDALSEATSKMSEANIPL
jgi:predicted  nucleic acid-binding Zn-ribbon protein